MSEGNWLVPSSLNYSKFQEWKRRQAQPTPTQPETRLPLTFANELLAAEMDIESDSFDLNTVIQLLQLYRAGTEYYESIRDDRYLIFKSKAQSLLMRPSVQSVLDQKQQPKSMKHSRSLPTQQFAPLEQRSFITLRKKAFETQAKACDVESFMREQKRDDQRLSIIRESDLQKQTQHIESRLDQRRQRARNPVKQLA